MLERTGVFLTFLVVVTHLGLLVRAGEASRGSGVVGILLGNVLRLVLSSGGVLGLRNSDVYLVLVVGRAEAFAILALGDVNGAAVGFVTSCLDSDVRVCVLGVRCGTVQEGRMFC